MAPLGGNSLDQALWSGLGSGAGDEVAAAAADYQRLSILPFDHERQLVSVLVKTQDGDALLITKGAPEAVLARCVDVPGGARRPSWTQLFSEGARVVAVAKPRCRNAWRRSPPRTNGV